MENLIEKISTLIQENSTRYVYEKDAKTIATKILELPELKAIQVQAKVKPACGICDLKRFCKIYQLWVSEEAYYFNKDRDDFYCKHFESGKNTGKIAGM